MSISDNRGYVILQMTKIMLYFKCQKLCYTSDDRNYVIIHTIKTIEIMLDYVRFHRAEICCTSDDRGHVMF